MRVDTYAHVSSPMSRYMYLPVDTCIYSSVAGVGVNEVRFCVFGIPRGVNGGVGMVVWALHMPRVYVRGSIHTLTDSHGLYWPPF